MLYDVNIGKKNAIKKTSTIVKIAGFFEVHFYRQTPDSEFCQGHSIGVKLLSPESVSRSERLKTFSHQCARRGVLARAI